MDSEQQSLLLKEPAVEAAQTLFASEEHNQSKDISEIIKSCLKDIKKCNNKRSIKMLSQLSAVSAYIKLHVQYQKHNACKWPCLSASLAIARQMGKGPYFARQIRQNELYLLKNQHLPPHKSFAQHGHHTLLDNETILHDVHIYFASQALGTVSPQILCQHVNNIILPALGIKRMIAETTAHWWLKSKKGMYVDGHERPDVIEERKEFVNQIFNKYERWVGCIQCPNHPMILIYYW